MFNKNDLVVYGPYGICEVSEVRPQHYVLKNENAIFLMPKKNSNKIRALVEKSDVPNIIKAVLLANPKEKDTWNKRYRELNELLNTGHLESIASVYGSLRKLSNIKDLSFGETKMMDRAKTQLFKELSIVLHIDDANIEILIYDNFL